MLATGTFLKSTAEDNTHEQKLITAESSSRMGSMNSTSEATLFAVRQWFADTRTVVKLHAQSENATRALTTKTKSENITEKMTNHTCKLPSTHRVGVEIEYNVYRL